MSVRNYNLSYADRNQVYDTLAYRGMEIRINRKINASGSTLAVLVMGYIMGHGSNGCSNIESSRMLTDPLVHQEISDLLKEKYGKEITVRF